MKMALLSAMVALAASAAAHAQKPYSDKEIISSIAACMLENAPQDWQRLIFTLEEEAPTEDQKRTGTFEHKVVTSAPGSEPQDLKPCRPLYVPTAVNALRENQDAKARAWTGITITLERDGRYSINYRYPK